MRILTHPMHTAFDFDLSKTGHQFFSVNGTWDSTQRPKPENWSLIGEPTVGFDLGLSVDFGLASRMSALGMPVIVNMLSDYVTGSFPDGFENAISKAVFLGPEPASRWRMCDESKKRIIPLGIDQDVYSGYVGGGGGALTVGGCLPKRGAEKGVANLVAIDAHVNVTLVGPVNDGLRCAIGMVSLERLQEMYRRYSVYLNPGPLVGISMAEAMTVGMPIVTFRTINLQALIEDGKNGYVVDTVAQAIDRIRMLLSDAGLRAVISRAARETAVRWFGIRRFISDWNTLFTEVAVAGRR